MKSILNWFKRAYLTIKIFVTEIIGRDPETLPVDLNEGEKLRIQAEYDALKAARDEEIRLENEKKAYDLRVADALTLLAATENAQAEQARVDAETKRKADADKAHQALVAEFSVIAQAAAFSAVKVEHEKAVSAISVFAEIVGADMVEVVTKAELASCALHATVTKLNGDIADLTVELNKTAEKAAKVDGFVEYLEPTA